MFDIDGFKSINDGYGHSVGDTVLKELTSLVAASIRKSDIFIRWGGEEFAILLRSSDPQKAAEVAEQLRQKIDAHRFNTVIHLTCSFGVTQVQNGEPLDAAFKRADTALYRAKHGGKNLVRIDLPPFNTGTFPSYFAAVITFPKLFAIMLTITSAIKKY